MKKAVRERGLFCVRTQINQAESDSPANDE
jgi:hypothetical protein